MDKTYIEYKEWLESEPIDSNIESSYRNAVEMLKQRESLKSAVFVFNFINRFIFSIFRR